MRHHIRSVRVLALCAAGMMVHAADAAAQDDMEKARDDAKQRMHLALDSAIMQVDAAIGLLGTIASSEDLVLGKSMASDAAGFTNRFAHPSLIDDYIRFTSEHQRAEDVTRTRAELQSVNNSLSKLKEGLSSDYIQASDVEQELKRITLPDVAALTGRKEVAEKLVARASELPNGDHTQGRTLGQAVEARLQERLRLARLQQQIDDTRSSTRVLTDAECQKLAYDPEVLALFEHMVSPSGKSPWNWHLNRLGAGYHDKDTFISWLSNGLRRHYDEQAVSVAIERCEAAAKRGLTYWELFRVIAQYRRDLFLTESEQLTFLAAEQNKRRRANSTLVTTLQLPPLGPALPPPNTCPPLERDMP